jgi:hypothetical protein
MKSEFLKIAGVKSDKAFYKKYPTEAAFFKAHPEAKKMVKKAQQGAVMSGMSSYLQGMQGMNNLPNMQNMMQGQMQSPGVNAGMFNGPQVNNNVSTINASPGGPNTNVEKGNSSGITKGLESLPGLPGELMKGYNKLRAERRAKKEAQKWAKVTNVQAQAAESTDVDDFRQYTENARKKANAMMPEMTGEEFFPVYGVGTNVLARNGVRLEGGGEIQNTYAPSTLYDDLEYEPLNDSDQIKAYKQGGKIYVAKNGFSNWMNTMGGGGSGFSGASGSGGAGAASGGGTPWGAIGQVGSGVAKGATGNNAGGDIGGSVGGAVGSIFGPAGQAIGQIGGSLIGGLLDTNPRDMRKAQSKIKNNTNRIMASQFKDSVHSQYGSYMRNGGYMNPEYNPQVIAKFGDLDAQDYAEFAKKDQFRAGGHLKAYREPSERAMQTYDMGGELQTHWGGYAEPMSENPYLPGGGETVMFRGKSHEESDGKGNTGIGITFGDSPVEVERGEPAVKLKDGSSGEESLVVYGNLKIPNEYVSIIGDPKAKGKKFKNYVADLSKVEQKQNKIVEKSTNELNELDVKTPFDKLKLSSLEANIKGGNMKLKSIADKKIKAADIQNAINETAEEYGLVADDLAKGKIKIDKKAMNMREAMFGTKLTKAENGVTDPPKASTYDPKQFEEVKELYRQAKAKGIKSKEALALQQKFHEYFPDVAKEIILGNPEITGKARKMGYKNIADLSKADRNIILNTNVDEYMGPRTEQYMAALARLEVPKIATTPERKETKKDEPAKEENKFEIIKNKKNPWINLGYQTLKGILDRPYEEELSPDQLMGEYYAMSANQVEPVQATPYTPQLRVPYDISLQDQLNEITADQRSAQRMMGYNPAAQANLAAQTYGAKSKVLADQFRANQAMKDQVYSGNIATLNDAELKNLAIYDQQYTRQEQAKSNTKAIAQAALSSIGDKLAKHKADVREYNVYKTLFPQYGFDRSGRGRFEGGYADFNTPQSQYPFYNNPNYALVKNSDGTFTYKLKDQVTEDDQVVEQPVQTSSSKTPSFNPNAPVYEDDEYEYILKNKEAMDEVAPKRAGGKIRKNYSQSSIVKAFK